MEPWIAIYDRETGELIYRAPGRVCAACLDIELGTDLDDDGRCSTCGPLESVCESCDCAWPSEDMTRGMCPGCADADDENSGVWTVADEARSGGV